tara:strand:+ start:319 stop:582 length:264 start_codon:yes stop_codon:yes gene_type:complete
MIEYHSRYSDTDDSDHRGRWARIGVVNKIQIACISKHTIKGIDKYSASCNFPTQLNDIAKENKVCDSLAAAKEFIAERWVWFKENTK